MSPTRHEPRTAQDIMTARPVCAKVGMTIRAVARIFDEHQVSGAPVVDAKGRLVGVVSRTDLVKRYSVAGDDRDPMMLVELFGSTRGAAGSGLEPSGLLLIEDFMTTDPVTAEPSTPVQEVANRMLAGRVHRVIIVDAKLAPVGVVTSLDLVRVLAGS
jgi:CBS domain-containing protein